MNSIPIYSNGAQVSSIAAFGSLRLARSPINRHGNETQRKRDVCGCKPAVKALEEDRIQHPVGQRC